MSGPYTHTPDTRTGTKRKKKEYQDLILSCVSKRFLSLVVPETVVNYVFFFLWWTRGNPALSRVLTPEAMILFMFFTF